MNFIQLNKFIKKVLNESNNNKTLSRINDLSKTIGDKEIVNQFIKRIDDHKLNEIIDQIEIEFDSRKF